VPDIIAHLLALGGAFIMYDINFPLNDVPI
jgi:hypothetical protein